MAKSSVAMPTKRESNSCSRSSFGPKRIMAWNKPRASRLLVERAVVHVIPQIGVQMIEVPGVAAHPLFRIPARVKRAGAEHRFDPRRHRQLRVENRAADLEMRIERFARNEEPHDFARTFEDRVDAAIAQEPLDRDRFVAARRRAIARFRNRVRRAPASRRPRFSRSFRSPTFCTWRFRSADRPLSDRPEPR